MSNKKPDFFNFSEEDEIESSPNHNSSASESELIAFTDNVMTMIRSDELPYVLVHIYGTKARRMNAQEIHGVFKWNPDPSDIASFHLPTAAKTNIAELKSGTDYYAFVRTPDSEKVGGVLISIKKDSSGSPDVWRNESNLPTKVPKFLVEPNAVGNPPNSMEAMMAVQTKEMFSLVFKNYMDKFKSSLEQTIMGGGNEELDGVKAELRTLQGALLEDSKRKEEEHKRSMLNEKDREIEILKEQIELIHQKINTGVVNTPLPAKDSSLSSILQIVKSLGEAKDVVFPILEGLGMPVPKMGAGQQLGQANFPTMPNIPPQVKGEVYTPPPRETQSVNQKFTGFEEEDISFSGFDDISSQTIFNDTNVSNNNIEDNMEVDPMSYKKMSDKVMIIIFNKFKITDVIKDVIPMVKEEVSKNFWSLIKESGFDENFVLGVGLKNPGKMAKDIMKHMPSEILSMVQNNSTGVNYMEVVEQLLTEVISESAKSMIQ